MQRKKVANLPTAAMILMLYTEKVRTLLPYTLVAGWVEVTKLASLIALAGVWITAVHAAAVATFQGAVGAVETLDADCRVEERITGVLY